MILYVCVWSVCVLMMWFYIDVQLLLVCMFVWVYMRVCVILSEMAYTFENHQFSLVLAALSCLSQFIVRPLKQNNKHLSKYFEKD